MTRLGDYQVKAADGERTLMVNVSGAEHGWPIFLLHGTPGSRTGPMPRPGALYRRGIRLISYDRPGYGGSTEHRGRRVVDAAADVHAIAEQLGLTRFSVVGRSGGGPHALAVAARLASRVHRVATLVSLAPSAPDLDFAAGMTPDNAAGFDRSAQPEAAGLSERLLRRARRVADDPRVLLDQLLADMTDADRLIVEEPAIQRLLLISYREAVRSGPYGWIDDVLALRRDWGFDVGEIKLPVYLWHGAQDNFAPAAHARWLARNIPGAILDMQSARAHFGAVEALPKVLTWLAGGDRPESFEMPEIAGPVSVEPV
ncbi:alpha/beta fold hydrolase [Actinoplanes sp. L3-i22]|uniref:alpha/beta fold hydrolase n=1 Tax=Actinoplanes sp. L3-i22 TaxID=2836373 RepID=UPI001C7971B4|nr:alpha/beta fold hydrolase [Actinoplanes sp. L3-i22]BCY09376.1 alpha/beta hydrolase [Actinoplanes sp. L3-i22]